MSKRDAFPVFDKFNGRACKTARIRHQIRPDAVARDAGITLLALQNFEAGGMAAVWRPRRSVYRALLDLAEASSRETNRRLRELIEAEHADGA